MAQCLLDTDAVIDYLGAITGTVSLIQGLFERGDSLCVCDVVVAEIYAGLSPEDRDRAQQLLDSFVFLSTSPEAARKAGEWRYAYARQGVTLQLPDVLVAATAYLHQASVVTGNTRHFPREVPVLPLPRPRR